MSFWPGPPKLGYNFWCRDPWKRQPRGKVGSKPTETLDTDPKHPEVGPIASSNKSLACHVLPKNLPRCSETARLQSGDKKNVYNSNVNSNLPTRLTRQEFLLQPNRLKAHATTSTTLQWLTTMHPNMAMGRAVNQQFCRGTNQQ